MVVDVLCVIVKQCCCFNIYTMLCYCMQSVSADTGNLYAVAIVTSASRFCNVSAGTKTMKVAYRVSLSRQNLQDTGGVRSATGKCARTACCCRRARREQSGAVTGETLASTRIQVLADLCAGARPSGSRSVASAGQWARRAQGGCRASRSAGCGRSYSAEMQKPFTRTPLSRLCVRTRARRALRMSLTPSTTACGCGSTDLLPV